MEVREGDVFLDLWTGEKLMAMTLSAQRARHVAYTDGRPAQPVSDEELLDDTIFIRVK